MVINERDSVEKTLYKSFHLNFVSPFPRALLEELSASVARDGIWSGLGHKPVSILHLTFAFSFLSLLPLTPHILSLTHLHQLYNRLQMVFLVLSLQWVLFGVHYEGSMGLHH
jgi:hypothetical protein